jgi:hypothetical protein
MPQVDEKNQQFEFNVPSHQFNVEGGAASQPSTSTSMGGDEAAASVSSTPSTNSFGLAPSFNF